LHRQSVLERRLALRNHKKFHYTNKDWNELKLNHSWVIGSLGYLFKQSKALSWEEWQTFYFHSGNERNRLLANLNQEKQRILTDFTIPGERKYNSMNQLSAEEKRINTHYGRTADDLKRIGVYFYQELCKRGHKKFVTQSEVIDFAFIRAVDETFIGFQREIKTIESLKNMFPFLVFEDVPYQKDVEFAIDTEVIYNEKLVCAIQVKSLSYFNSQRSFIEGVKKMNHNKNDAYTKKYGVPVLYAYADANGTIHNDDLLKTLHAFINKAS
jgi:hypothetical protein